MSIQSKATPATRPAVVLAAAVGLGALGDLLFSPGLLGINVFLWTGALAGAVVLLARTGRVPLRGQGRWLLAPALLFAGFVAWRSSPVLQAINLGTVVALLAIASFRMRDGRIRIGAVTEYFWLAMLSACSVLIGLAELLFREVDWRRTWSDSRGSHVAPFLRGAAFAIPLVVVFAALMASADAVFSNAVNSLIAFEIKSVAAHLARALLWTWIAGGFLHGTLIQEAEDLPESSPAPMFRLGPVEVGTVLGALDLLFLAFVAIQVRYLFGGEAHIEITDGLTYAEYARHGFFELLAVAALVLPLVLGVHWLLRDSSPALRIAFRVLSAALILLVYVVVASALQRMRLYVDEFGLTQLRLYSTAFMLWLVVVFGWLVVTVLRERRQRFAFGALISGTLAVSGLNVLNPDAFIVRTNLERADERAFDAGYAGKLSPDATPTLVAALPQLSPGERCRVGNALLRDLPDDGGWQAWNYGRERAKDATKDALAASGAPCPGP